MRLTVFQRLLILSMISCIALFIHFRRPGLLASRVPQLPWSGLSEPQDKVSTPLRNSTARPDLLDFWHQWARHIHSAKPQVQHVGVVFSAPNTPAPENPLALRQKPDSYVRLGDADVDRFKAAHAQIKGSLENLEAATMAHELFDGIGVVVVAGGEYFGPAIVGIKMLRQTGSSLPVEVFLANWAEYEPALCDKFLPRLNARCVVLEDYLEPRAPSDGVNEFSVTHYQLKSLAILLSSFRHVLYLDSDSIVLVDPEQELFSSEPYATTGFVGWPDFWEATEQPRFYEIAGLPGDEFPQGLPAACNEAGQLLLDKGRHLKTLLLATYYNIWGPDYYYPLLSQGALGQGDKETFAMAAFVLQQPFYRVKTLVKAVGRNNTGEFKGTAMVQWHPGDDYRKFGNPSAEGNPLIDNPLDKAGDTIRPAFIHSNTPKMNAGHLVDEGDLKDGGTGKRLRLWGTTSQEQAIFGHDLEKRVWNILVEIGCELENVIMEWRQRKNLCKRLREHYDEVFN